MDAFDYFILQKDGPEDVSDGLAWRIVFSYVCLQTNAYFTGLGSSGTPIQIQ